MARISKRVGVVALLLGGIAVIAPAFFSGTSTLGGYGGYGGMMGGYGGMMGGYGGMGGFGTVGTTGAIFSLVSQLGFLLLLVGGGYLLYRSLRGNGDTDYFGTSDTALDELRLAYARGDLSEEEFEMRRKRLQQQGER